MKKKMITVLALVLALSLLTSCEMFVPGPTERPPIGGAEPTGSADPGPSQTLWQEGSGPDSDRRFIQNYICATGDTVYFSSGNLIYYADKATGICLPLCGKPECTHNDENCNAYGSIAGIYGLASYNGRLYWVGQEGTWENWDVHWHLYSMAYDGTDRRTVRDLPADWISSNRTVFHRGYLYKNWLTQEVVNGVAKQVGYVEAYPLEGDGEGLVILRAENVYNYWIKIQAYEEYVYIAFQTEDGTFELHRWDTRAGELETLYRETVPFSWNAQFWVMEDGVVFGSREYTGPDEDPEASWEYALYRISFETGQIELLNRLWINEGNYMDYTNVTLSDGMVIANWWDTDSDGIRVLVKDFAGQTLFDTTFEDVEWCIFPSYPMTGFGVDEDYLYFSKTLWQLISVSRDGSEIRLLWSKDT